MSPKNSSDQTAIVVGASRGLGRGIATALAQAGASVTAVARDQAALGELAQADGDIRPEVADATDPTVAGSLLDRYDPDALVLVAGARPLIRPLQHQTWETFSSNWNSDVRMAFHWLREALLKPTRQPGRYHQQRRGPSRLAAQRRIRRGEGHPALHRCLRPRGGRPPRSEHQHHNDPSPDHAPHRTRSTCRPGLRRARRKTVEEYMQPMGPLVTPEAAGAAVLELLQAEPASVAPAYLLTGAGITPMP
jgi:short chain dehydrogenase